MSKPIIEVRNLSKLYEIGPPRSRSLRESAERWMQRLQGKPVIYPQSCGQQGFGENQQGPRPNTFWALKGVSFSVEQGEVVGVIGRNGAGKSTLLKILSRITEPTSGHAVLRGRVASLLEVGTGFHPDLTGRENVYLNGAILGMRKQEIEKKFDEIVAFSEIEKFIDTPVKHYSSGMYVRLAFAVAAHLDPEILLVDEVLAVGDAAFQKKCLGKMNEVARLGRTVFFVSHNLGAVQQLTQQCVLLDNGQLKKYKQTAEAINEYIEGTESSSVHGTDLRHYARPYKELSQDIFFIKAELNDCRNGIFEKSSFLSFSFKMGAKSWIDTLRISMVITGIDGHPVGSFFSSTVRAPAKGEEAVYHIKVHDHKLACGKFRCSAAVGQGNSQEKIREFDAVFDILSFEIGSSGKETYDYWCPGWGAICFDNIEIKKEAS